MCREGGVAGCISSGTCFFQFFEFVIGFQSVRVSIGVADGFSLRGESVGARIVWCIPFENVSCNFLWCFIAFQRDRVVLVVGGGFPFRAASVRVRVVAGLVWE